MEDSYIEEGLLPLALPTGTISMSQVAAELGISQTGINLNDSRVRGLAGKPSGIISMSDLRGKSSAPYKLVIGRLNPSTWGFNEATFSDWGMVGDIDPNTVDGEQIYTLCTNSFQTWLFTKVELNARAVRVHWGPDLTANHRLTKSDYHGGYYRWVTTSSSSSFMMYLRGLGEGASAGIDIILEK